VPRFIDTNVIVRFLTDDIPERARVAERILQSDDVVVSCVILSEVAYVLRSGYRYAREQVLDALVQFLTLDNVDLIDVAKGRVVSALTRAKGAPGLSLGDAFILAQMEASGYTEIYSFDKRFRDAGITVLERPAG
jgi:predicted nucleic acid-binding protein